MMGAHSIRGRAEMMNAIRQILTEEQVTQLTEMKRSHFGWAPW